MSKPISKLLLSFLVAQTIFPILVNAASSPESLNPSNAFTYIEVNTGAEHPLKGDLVKLFGKPITSDANEQEAVIAKILLPYLDQSVISYSQGYNQSTFEDIYFLTMALPETVFQDLLAAAPDLASTNLGYNKFVYSTGDDFNFSYKNGNLIASNVKAILSDLLLQSNPSNVGQNPDFQFLNSQSAPASFLKVFVNFANLPASVDSSTQRLIQSEGFSFHQTNYGIEGVVTVTPGKDSTLDLNSYNFTPGLYKKINPANLLLYTESSDIANHSLDSLKALNAVNTTDLNELLNNLVVSFSENTGLDLNIEIAPLFKNRSALTIHSNWDKQFLPAFSLLSEVKGQETLAKSTISKLVASLKKNMDKVGSSYSSSSLVTSNGTFDQITASLDDSPDTDQATLDPNNQITFSMGVTNDGLLLLTTLKNPEDLFVTNGLSNDPEWNSQFISDSVSGISYLNFSNLQTYLLNLTKQSGSPTTIFTTITEFISPLKSFYSYTKSIENNFVAHFKLHLDQSKVSDLVQYIESLDWNTMFGGYSAEFSDQINSGISDLQSDLGGSVFTDVPTNTWFSKAVRNLAKHQIMTGYGDLFKPDQSITRAEFLKTIITAEENIYNETYSATTSVNNFPSDPDMGVNAWYISYINQAIAQHFVSGYPDGTFRPNQPITRAEAVKILTNFNQFYFYQDDTKLLHQLLGENHPFSDVRPSDWFYDAVYGAYWQKIVTGKTVTEFAPHDLLTRAETAVLINRYIDEE